MPRGQKPWSGAFLRSVLVFPLAASFGVGRGLASGSVFWRRGSASRFLTWGAWLVPRFWLWARFVSLLWARIVSLVLAVGADCVLGPDCGRGVASRHLVLALGAVGVLGPCFGRGLCPWSWLWARIVSWVLTAGAEWRPGI